MLIVILTQNSIYVYNVPERKDFIFNCPTISDRNTFPLELTRIFNFSITSKNISFFLCFIPVIYIASNIICSINILFGYIVRKTYTSQDVN